MNATTNTSAASPAGPQVGRPMERLEARAKVTGAADYTHNLRLPRMLHAKVVRSPHAHARILSIDTRAAAAVPGVVRVEGGSRPDEVTAQLLAACIDAGL